VTARELLHWSRLHERRARRGWSRSPWLVAIVAGGAIAGLVQWRTGSWLPATIVAFALAFLRVPFQLYWRADAALLAQLPIAGGALVDVALVRCARAAAATTLAVVIGAAPLASDAARFGHHVMFAAALGLAAAGLLPAAALWAAILVAAQHDAGGATALRVATAVGMPRASASGPATSAGTLLGALPGFVATVVFVVVLVASPYLAGESATAELAPYLGGLAAASVLALVITRRAAAPVMGTILRDVSALDRQRLATLDLRPPTAIERAIASLLGDAALPYRKDARLMRRRYPMAFALGALAFVVLAIIALARPRDPTPWLVATLAGAALYALALAGRLRRPPIELARLSATLPIPPGARTRAKLAWLASWLVLFVVIPAVFALVRLG
jgi:hypothetical protein